MVAGEFRYPDFLCIGAQKAGTSWLDRNLRNHPKLWLPPMKELQYFSHLYLPEARKWTSRQRRERGSQLLQQYIAKSASEKVDYRLVARLADIIAGQVSDDWYGRIFALARPDQICGEVTPEYCALPDEGIQHILKLSPQIRVILSLRDPIARSWSHLRMVAQNRGIKVAEKLAAFAEKDELVLRANYPAILARWRRFVPEDRFLVLFLEDIEQTPNVILERVCRFVGVDYVESSFPEAAKPVHVGQSMEIPASILEILKSRFRPIYDEIAILYPEYGSRWRAQYY